METSTKALKNVGPGHKCRRQLEAAPRCAGASGGAASAARVIAPQFIPISQLVLLTVKVQRELQARAMP